MGRKARGYTKGAAHVALQQAHAKPLFDQQLAERLFDASPLLNIDIKRAFAETYVLVDMQLKDLRSRICDGTISNDEARTIPTLVSRLAQLTAQLHLNGIKDGFALTLSDKDEEIDEAE